jgi:hypothetical protein
MQTEGYMIVLKSDILLERYAGEWAPQHNPEPLRALRSAFSQFDIAGYRGVSRKRLLAYPSLEQKVLNLFEATGIDMKTDAEARRQFRVILGDLSEDENPEIDEYLISSLSDAREVLGLTDEPSRWEIIHVARGNAEPGSSFLGYDVGYWGGDFSLIADTIVVPRWHPPIPDDFAEVAQALSGLNVNLLFGSSADAAGFKAFYKSKLWAETEDREGEFCIIRVGLGE